MDHRRSTTLGRRRRRKYLLFMRLGVLLSCAIIVPLTSSGQQVVKEQTIPKTILAKTPSRLERIGLAPQDRPACRLPPPGAQKKSAASATSDVPNSVGGKFPSFGDSLLDPSNNTATMSPQLQAPANQPWSSSNGKDRQLAQPLISNSRKSADSSERLRQLRQLLVSNNYDAYLVTPNDEHGMEYVSEYDRRLRFISGFTGSNGFALILLDRAVLFTDGRYAIQADLDLDCNWWLVVGSDPVEDIPKWLRTHAPKGLKIATDARLMTLQVCDTLDEQLKKMDSEFVLISQDLVDVVWNAASGDGSGEPARIPSQEPIFVQPLKFAGNVSWQEKVVELSDLMGKLRAKHYIVSQLDDVAWLLNLRGGDIPMAPLFKSFLFISRQVEPAGGSLQPVRATSQAVEQLLKSSKTPLTSGDQLKAQVQDPRILQIQPSQTVKITMYVDLSKITRPIRDHLRLDNENGTVFVSQAQGGSANSKSPSIKQADALEAPQIPLTTKIQIELKDYDVFIMDLRDRMTPTSGGRQIQGKLLLNAGSNVAIHVLSKGYDDRVVLVESLVGKLKSVKNDAEVQGMRVAHWRDSLAISMLLSQLDNDIGLRNETAKWTETSAAKELEFYRSLMDYNRGQSFDSISAYGSNSAIVHYKPSESESTFIGNQSTYLLDTGGQYLDGTTDITRTVHFGQPSDFQRETYTRVLLGAIDMMSLVFESSQSKLGDLPARRYLFELGLDYAHGTGHGIGLFSMVHESPWLLEQHTSSGGLLRACINKQRSQQGPQLISEPVPLQANMFTSVEPGYYKANDFGMRLENIVVTQKFDSQLAVADPGGQFLRFEPISLVPFEPKLIKYELLSNKQKTWLNSYNLMVRFRLTQQINYYLTKMRQTQDANKQNETGLAGAAESSLGYFNYLRMDAKQLQAKLEQTHRWIMEKTEIVPLDVPRSLLSSVRSHTSGEGNERSPHSREGNLDGQRLMLAYMSSLPFNDLEAGAAIADMQSVGSTTLGGRGSNTGGRSGGVSEIAGNNKSERAVSGAKCSGGIECDLMLVNALNLLQQKRQREQWISSKDPEDDFISLVDEPGKSEPEAHGGGDSSSSMSFSSLMDMFRLNGGRASGIAGVFNVWSVVVLSTFVVLQLGIITYMCSGSNSGSHRVSGDWCFLTRAFRRSRHQSAPSVHGEQTLQLRPPTLRQGHSTATRCTQSSAMPTGVTRLDSISVAD